MGLGDSYFDGGFEDLSREPYEKAWSLEVRLVKACLRLSYLASLTGDIEACIRYANAILRTIDLKYERALENVSDLADVYLCIGHELEKSGNRDMFVEAARVALNLNPRLAENALETHNPAQLPEAADPR
jgi:tetratricopeptide (TPR) repeat protein